MVRMTATVESRDSSATSRPVNDCAKPAQRQSKAIAFCALNLPMERKPSSAKKTADSRSMRQTTANCSVF